MTVEPADSSVRGDTRKGILFAQSASVFCQSSLCNCTDSWQAGLSCGSTNCGRLKAAQVPKQAYGRDVGARGCQGREVRGDVSGAAPEQSRGGARLFGPFHMSVCRGLLSNGPPPIDKLREPSPAESAI